MKEPVHTMNQCSWYLTALSLSCFVDSASIARLKRTGSMASVVQPCTKCLKENFTWRSQSMNMGRHAAGNIMTSVGIFMSGISISQAILMFNEPCHN